MKWRASVNKLGKSARGRDKAGMQGAHRPGRLVKAKSEVSENSVVVVKVQPDTKRCSRQAGGTQ